MLKTDILENSIDLVVTSPPYNVGIHYNKYQDGISYDKYCQFSLEWMKKVYSWLKPDGRMCINLSLDKSKGGREFLSSDINQISKQAGFKYNSIILWLKNSVKRNTAWGSWKSASSPYIFISAEIILVLYKDVWKKKWHENLHHWKRRFYEVDF